MPKKKLTSSDLARDVERITSRYDLGTVWRDFVEMSAISFSNAVDLRQRAEREETYLRISKRYDKDELDRVDRCLGMLTILLDQDFDDVLGSTFMNLELGSKTGGQFFTPYAVCKMIAQMQLEDAESIIASKGFVTVNDPSSGGGSLLIAVADVLASKGINFQKYLYVTAQDIDPRSAHMTYVQLAILGIAGEVIVGDTLRLETRERWYTPMHFLGNWKWKMRQVLGGEGVEIERATC